MREGGREGKEWNSDNLDSHKSYHQQLGLNYIVHISPRGFPKAVM